MLWNLLALLVITLLLCSCDTPALPVSNSVVEQAKPAKEERSAAEIAAALTAVFEKYVNVSLEQRIEINKLALDVVTERSAIYAETSSSAEQKQTQLNDLDAVTLKRAKLLLTPEQDAYLRTSQYSRSCQPKPISPY